MSSSAEVRLGSKVRVRGGGGGGGGGGGKDVEEKQPPSLTLFNRRRRRRLAPAPTPTTPASASTLDRMLTTPTPWWYKRTLRTRSATRMLCRVSPDSKFVVTVAGLVSSSSSGGRVVSGRTGEVLLDLPPPLGYPSRCAPVDCCWSPDSLYLLVAYSDHCSGVVLLYRMGHKNDAKEEKEEEEEEEGAVTIVVVRRLELDASIFCACLGPTDPTTPGAFKVIVGEQNRFRIFDLSQQRPPDEIDSGPRPEDWSGNTARGFQSAAMSSDGTLAMISTGNNNRGTTFVFNLLSNTLVQKPIQTPLGTPASVCLSPAAKVTTDLDVIRHWTGGEVGTPAWRHFGVIGHGAVASGGQVNIYDLGTRDCDLVDTVQLAANVNWCGFTGGPTPAGKDELVNAKGERTRPALLAIAAGHFVDVYDVLHRVTTQRFAHPALALCCSLACGILAVATSEGALTLRNMQGGEVGMRPFSHAEGMAWYRPHSAPRRLRREFTQNRFITSCFLSADGNWLASGGTDKVVTLRDLACGHDRKVMFRHPRQHDVFACCVVRQEEDGHHRRRRLVMAGGNATKPPGTGVVTVYDAESCDVVRQFNHTSPVRACCFNRDATLVAACCVQGRTTVHELRSGANLAVFPPNESGRGGDTAAAACCFDSTSSRVAVVWGNTASVHSRDGSSPSVRLLVGGEGRRGGGERAAVYDCCFSNDGRYVIVLEEMLGERSKVSVHLASSGRCALTIPLGPCEYNSARGCAFAELAGRAVVVSAFAPPQSGGNLDNAAAAATLVVHDLATGKLIPAVSPISLPGRWERTRESDVGGVSASDDGVVAVAVGNRVLVLDLAQMFEVPSPSVALSIARARYLPEVDMKRVLQHAPHVVNSVDHQSRRTLLHYAVVDANNDLLGALLSGSGERGVAVSICCDRNGVSALQLAIAKSNFTAVERLLCLAGAGRVAAGDQTWLNILHDVPLCFQFFPRLLIPVLRCTDARAGGRLRAAMPSGESFLVCGYSKPYAGAVVGGGSDPPDGGLWGEQQRMVLNSGCEISCAVERRAMLPFLASTFMSADMQGVVRRYSMLKLLADHGAECLDLFGTESVIALLKFKEQMGARTAARLESFAAFTFVVFFTAFSFSLEGGVVNGNGGEQIIPGSYSDLDKNDLDMVVLALIFLHAIWVGVVGSNRRSPANVFWSLLNAATVVSLMLLLPAYLYERSFESSPRLLELVVPPAIILSYVRLLYCLRDVSQISMYLELVIETLGKIKAFLAILFITFAGFAVSLNLFSCLRGDAQRLDETLSRMFAAGSSMDEIAPHTLEYTILTVHLFVVVVVLLNVLVAVILDGFGRVQERATLQSRLGRAARLADIEDCVLSGNARFAALRCCGSLLRCLAGFCCRSSRPTARAQTSTFSPVSNWSSPLTFFPKHLHQLVSVEPAVATSVCERQLSAACNAVKTDDDELRNDAAFWKLEDRVNANHFALMQKLGGDGEPDGQVVAAAAAATVPAPENRDDVSEFVRADEIEQIIEKALRRYSAMNVDVVDSVARKQASKLSKLSKRIDVLEGTIHQALGTDSDDNATPGKSFADMQKGALQPQFDELHGMIAHLSGAVKLHEEKRRDILLRSSHENTENLLASFADHLLERMASPAATAEADAVAPSHPRPQQPQTPGTDSRHLQIAGLKRQVKKQLFMAVTNTSTLYCCSGFNLDIIFRVGNAPPRMTALAVCDNMLVATTAENRLFVRPTGLHSADWQAIGGAFQVSAGKLAAVGKRIVSVNDGGVWLRPHLHDYIEEKPGWRQGWMRLDIEEEIHKNSTEIFGHRGCLMLVSTTLFGGSTLHCYSGANLENHRKTPLPDTTAAVAIVGSSFIVATSDGSLLARDVDDHVGALSPRSPRRSRSPLKSPRWRRVGSVHDPTAGRMFAFGSRLCVVNSQGVWLRASLDSSGSREEDVDCWERVKTSFNADVFENPLAVAISY